MMKFIVVAACVAFATARLSGVESEDIATVFESWRVENGVTYESASEYAIRQAIFAQNDKTIKAHNAANKDYKLAHNQFSAITGREFKARLSPMPPRPVGTIPFEPKVTSVPDSWDWDDEGAVTDVKDQGQCGSCWAFSAVGAAESAYYLSYGSLETFSEQQLVDCDNIDSGCNGGLMDYAFYYMESNGLASEDDYAYTGSTDTCTSSSYDMALGAGVVTGYTDVTSGDEDALKTAVYQQPVAVAIEADQSAFQFYSSGVLTGTCGTSLDHGVLAVGYGTDSGTDYWNVKNSWGSSWGENGYVRIERGTDKCGIADEPSYPNM